MLALMSLATRGELLGLLLLTALSLALYWIQTRLVRRGGPSSPQTAA
jgi:hypothetical protein